MLHNLKLVNCCDLICSYHPKRKAFHSVPQPYHLLVAHIAGKALLFLSK